MASLLGRRVSVAQEGAAAWQGGGETVSHAGSRAEVSRGGLLRRLSGRLETERDRWFLWLPVLYGGGIAAYFALKVEPSLLAATMPAIVALVIWWLLRRGTLTVVAAGIVLALSLGLAAAKLRTAWVAAPVLERPLNLAEVRGWVELVEPRVGRGQRITLRVASIRGVTPDRLPLRVRVRTMAVLAGLVPGDPIRLRATLAPPAIPSQPGDYDFARSAFYLRLGGVGYALARPERDSELGASPYVLRIEAAIARVRQAIGQRVRAALEGERGAIADALITGERGGISEATNAAYRDSGLYHIMSISGLHMSIMAGAVFLALRFLLAAVPAIALVYPIKKWAAGAATLAAFGYLLISGGSFATVRAWVMISVMFLAVLLDRPAIALRNVAVSALVILAVLPDSLLDVGFQMSFAAVVALVSAFEIMRERMHSPDGGIRPGPWLRVPLFLGAIVLTTLIASIAVAPFAAYHFHKSQQYAILANLIAIPICNVLVMPAALATLVLMPLGLEWVALWVMGIGIDVMTWCARTVAALPGAVGRVPAISQTGFAIMVLGGLWLCLWRTRWRLLGLAWMAIGAAVAPMLAKPDVLAGRDGQILAVRGETGVLHAVAERGTMFELSRWLERDGDARTARDVASAQAGLRCDASGCTALVKGTLVALGREASALGDDCARAGLVVLAIPRPEACQAQVPVIDLYDLRDKGTHAVHIDGARISIVTVADVRGERPWTGAPRQRLAERRLAAASARVTRLGQFVPPFALGDGGMPRRPEIEDEDDDR
jgi:competence protein ComEC